MRKLLVVLVAATVFSGALWAAAADEKKEDKKEPDKLTVVREKLKNVGINLTDKTTADTLVDDLHAEITKKPPEPTFMQKLVAYGRSPWFYWVVITIEATIIIWLLISRPRSEQGKM